METLEVTLFGGFQLRRGDRSVPPMPSRAARSLFAYLAVHPGTRHPRERLAALFWPDLPASRARRRLSHTLWQVQDALHELEGDVAYLEVTPESLAFDPQAPCRVDVEEFEAGLARARTRRGGDTRRVRDLTELEATIDLYRGDFLAGHGDPWVGEVQQRLHVAYLEALGWLVGLAKSHGAFDDALVYARRITNEDPLREDGHREVMRLSVLLGRPSDALRQFERCREVLAEELGSAPSAATAELHDRIGRQQRLSQLDAQPAGPAAGLSERVPLIGRDRERDTAVTLLDRALAGRGGVLLVEGEAGLGTSRLLTEIAEDAGWRAFSTVRVDCPAPERAAPYGVVRALLEATLTPIRVEQLRPRVAPVWLAEAATLLPALSRAVPREQRTSRPLRSDESAQRMRDALTQVLLALEAVEPLTLVVDDTHWCDLESLLVLEAVAEQVADRRMVLVLGYRGEEARATPAVWDALRSIDRRARPERLVLEPLDAFSTGELVRVLVRGRVVDPGAIGRLQRETGGNPLFLVETIRALAEEDHLDVLEDVEGAGEFPVTGSIRALALQRLDRLGSEVREVADAAAVIAGELDLDLLAATSELARPTVVDAADVLVRRGLLTQTPDAFTFCHDLVRRVAVDALTTGRRRALHRRIAEALEATESAAVERLAHHFLEAELPQRAVTYLQHAGRNAARVHAYATADQRYQLARELAVRGPQSVDRRFDVLAEHEAVLDVLGERERQLVLLDELVELAAGTPRREVEVARRRALLSGHLGDPDIGLRAAERAVAGARALADGGLLGPALIAQASVLAWAGRRGEAVPVLEAAVACAAEPDVALQAQVQLGSVLRELQRYAEAETVLETALVTAERDGAEREQAIAWGVLAAISMETGDSDFAIERYGLAVQRSVAIGFRRGEGVNLLNRGNTRWARGEFVAAVTDFGAAADVFAALRDRRGEAAVRSNLAFVLHAVAGDDDTARIELAAALAYFREIGDHMFAAQCLDTLAAIALRHGALDEAAAHLDEAGSGLAGNETATVWADTHLLRRRAELALARGEVQSALALARDAVEVALEHGLRDLLPVLRGLQGEILIALGRAEDALRATTAACHELHPGVERAYLVRFQHAEALRAAGQRSTAAQETARARDELEAVLAPLNAEVRERSRGLPEHRRIFDAVSRDERSRTVVVVAASRAPLGRALGAGERIEVSIDRGSADDDPDDPVEARRVLLARIVATIETAGGAPTVEDLAGALEVSTATVRRDLRVLRDAGLELSTRGRRSARGAG